MIPRMKAALDRTVMLLLTAVYIVQQLTYWDWLLPVLGILVFAAIALLLPQIRGMTLWLTASFMLFGVLLMLLQRADAHMWFEAARLNVTLVTLFVFAPLFGIPVRLPDYVEALKRFYETSVRSRTVLFAGTQLLTMIMSVFINVGAIPVVYHLAFVKPQPGMSRLLANAMNRGFGAAIFWSPYFAAMALVTSSLSLPWSDILPYLLGLSLLSFFVSFIVDVRGLRGRGNAAPPIEAEHSDAQLSEQPEQAVKEAEEETKTETDSRVFPIGLAIYLASAIAVILLLEQWVKLPMVMITCMAAVIFPLGWCVGKGVMAAYRQGLIHHVTQTLPALKKEITLFLAAGFFSGAISATGFGASVHTWLDPIPLPIAISFSIFTVVLIISTSIFGLHPIVTASILAGSIDPSDVHISPVYFAVLLLGSWGISNTISPATAVNNLLAGFFQRPVFEMASQNYKYAACMGIVLLLYLIIVPM